MKPHLANARKSRSKKTGYLSLWGNRIFGGYSHTMKSPYGKTFLPRGRNKGPR